MSVGDHILTGGNTSNSGHWMWRIRAGCTRVAGRQIEAILELREPWGLGRTSDLEADPIFAISLTCYLWDMSYQMHKLYIAPLYRQKLLTFPTWDFIWDSSKQFCSFGCKKPQSESFTVLRALSPEIFYFKDFNLWLTQFPLPHLEADSSAYAINRHQLWRRKHSASQHRLKNKIPVILKPLLRKSSSRTVKSVG